MHKRLWCLIMVGIILYSEWLPCSSLNVLQSNYLSLLRIHKIMSGHIIEWLINERVCVMCNSSQKLLKDFDVGTSYVFC